MDDDPLVQYSGCRGTLSWDESGTHHEADVVFALEVDRTGRIRLDVEDQPLSSDNFWIKTANSSSSPIVAALSLEARNSEGHLLRSETVHLSSVGTYSTRDSAILQMEAQASQLTVLVDQEERTAADEYQVEYRVAGLRWFRGSRFTLSSGEVAIAGDVKVDDFTKVSGTVAIRSPAKDQTLDSWLETADAEVRRILEVVSFADGHFMRATVRQVFQDKTLARIDFFGSRRGSAPHKPPLHCLHFAGTLPSLIQAYDDALIKRTGLDVAIEWHLMPHIYNEARFVSQMTAIEHLIHVFADRFPDSTYIDKKTFKQTVAPALVRTLERQIGRLCGRDGWWHRVLRLLLGRRDGTDSNPSGTTQEAVEGMSQGLRQINRRSLRSNLTRMLAEYDVPLEGLNESIGPLITTRNNIVHRGLHGHDDEGTSLGQRLTEAEELLRRIVLALLGFDGRYTTWLTRIEDRDFR
jgi:hypothetical protein